MSNARQFYLLKGERVNNNNDNDNENDNDNNRNNSYNNNNNNNNNNHYDSHLYSAFSLMSKSTL